MKHIKFEDVNPNEFDFYIDHRVFRIAKSGCDYESFKYNGCAIATSELNTKILLTALACESEKEIELLSPLLRGMPFYHYDEKIKEIQKQIGLI